MTALNGDQFLPGMESMRRAEPYEQTAAQFHNRPDVFVHGRYERTMRGSRELDLHDASLEFQGFHAGTEKSAHERLISLGPPWTHHEPRFYHGRVDPTQMQNTPVPGTWGERGRPAQRQGSPPGRGRGVERAAPRQLLPQRLRGQELDVGRPAGQGGLQHLRAAELPDPPRGGLRSPQAAPSGPGARASRLPGLRRQEGTQERPAHHVRATRPEGQVGSDRRHA
jgi:hypothetical protein